MNNQEFVPPNIINETEPKFSQNKCCGIYGLKNKITNKWYMAKQSKISILSCCAGT